jgi:hypothetical protein
MIESVHVKRGQWIRSYRKLAEDLKYKEGRGYKQPSHQAVEKAVKRLIQRGYIKISVIKLTHKLTDRLTDQLTKLRTNKELNKELINNNDFNFLNEDMKLTETEKLKLEIEEYYLTKKGKQGFYPEPKDQYWIEQTIKEKFTKEEIIEGIDHAFNTAESVNSFEYCLKTTRTLKKKKEQQKQWNQRKQQKKKQPYNPASQLPKSIREADQEQEQNKQSEIESPMTEEEYEAFKKEFAEFNRQADERMKTFENY